MEIGEIIKMQGCPKDILGYILSSNTDMGSSEGGLISVKAFPKLIDDLIFWKDQPPCDNNQTT